MKYTCPRCSREVKRTAIIQHVCIGAEPYAPAPEYRGGFWKDYHTRRGQSHG